jgi:hypothetical protein
MVFRENISRMKIQNILKPSSNTGVSRLNVYFFSAQNDINCLQTLFLLFSVFLVTLPMTFSPISLGFS